MLNLAEQANEPGWWHRYNDVMPGWLVTYVGLEQAATIIRCYEAQLSLACCRPRPTPTPTPSSSSARPPTPTGRTARRAADRQQLLEAPQPPDYWAVIDEAALRRNMGGRQVMRDQLDYLLEISERPNVTVQVVPFDRSGAAAAGGPFTLLRFAEPDLPDIVYLEKLTSALYLDKRVEVEAYVKIVDCLAAGALTPRQSTALIASVRDTL